MARKFFVTLSLFALATVLTGASFATLIPTQVTFGPNTTGSVTLGTQSATFAGGKNNTGFTGIAWQAGQPQGTFTLSGGVLHYATGNNPYTFGPNSQTVTFTIGPNTMTGLLSVQALYIGGPYGFFAGKYDITSSTLGFAQTGYPVGALVDIDFTTYNGTLSSGELVPTPVPEPGTIALVGSGLLAAAGMLRRKS